MWSTTAAAAQAPRAVIWLDHAAPSSGDGDGAARAERERALRLELQARNFVLLESRPSDPGAPPASTAATLLARTTATAVIWLEADKDKPVSWLFVRTREREEPGRSPLPHPPHAIEPQLLAIAAASLIDQSLRDADAPRAVVPTARQAAALSPPPPPPPAPVRPTVVPPPDEPRRDSFVQVGFALPFAYVTTGMEASSAPDPDDVFLSFPPGGDPQAKIFNDVSAHVPDADSFDDYEVRDFNGNVIVPRGTTPVSTACAADGTVTHAPELPSKYCARVDKSGFELVPALRIAIGTWVLPELALSAFYQWHFMIDAEEVLGAHAIGAQAEYVLAGQRRGFLLTMLGALSVGRTETPVPATNEATEREVNGLSGLFLAKTGFALRRAIQSYGAIIASTSLGGRFPESQVELELALGVEHGF